LWVGRRGLAGGDDGLPRRVDEFEFRRGKALAECAVEGNVDEATFAAGEVDGVRVDIRDEQRPGRGHHAEVEAKVGTAGIRLIVARHEQRRIDRESEPLMLGRTADGAESIGVVRCVERQIVAGDLRAVEIHGNAIVAN
jgi:hypothetical protein